MENELVIRIRSEGQHFCVQINNPYSGGYLLYDHKFKNVRIEGFNEKQTRSRRKRQPTRKGATIVEVTNVLG